MLTSTISECISRGKSCKYIRPQNRTFQRFLSKIGFNKFFGIDKNEPHPDRIEVGKIQLKRARGVDYQLVDQIMRVFTYHLNLSTGVRGALRLSMIETMTNAADHSGKEEYYLCSWPYRRQIRLCILDLGMGILDSLKSNPEYQYLSDDHEAIVHATQEGVSCRTGRAGLGLHHLKQLVSVNKGKMCIISGKGKVFWKGNAPRPLKQNMAVPFKGTIVKLVINIDRKAFYFFEGEREVLF